MSATWLVDALMGSPIPPPNWLDPRRRSSGWTSPHGFVRLGFTLRGYHVPAPRIAAELDELNTCVNPPLVQGWAWCLALVGVVATLLGFRGIRMSEAADGVALLMVLLPIPVWFAAVFAGGFFSHDVELRDGLVYVRRWTDVWLDRRGRLVGPRREIHAALSCGDHVQMVGGGEAVVVSMTMWPNSSRQSLEQRFEYWGIELEFPGRHHPHHPQHWNHGHHRLARPVPQQGQHRGATPRG
jgi:hypothetical protein